MLTKFETLGARLLIQARARQAHVRPSRVLRDTYTYPGLTPLRAAIASELRCAGFSYPEVGELLKRDSSTIQTLVKGRRR